MTRLLPATFLALLTLTAAATPAIADTERISQRIKLDPGGTLHLKSFSGRVTITGSDQSEVTIDAVRHASRELLDRVKLEVSSDSSSVRIVENRRDWGWRWLGRNDVVETDFDIKVPRRANLDITVFSASVNITGVEGSHRLETFSSTTTLDDVNGSIRAKSFSGPIQIRQTAWRGTPTVDVERFSGSVRLRLPESARGNLAFNSFSGSLTSDLPLTFQSSSRRNMSGQFGGTSGDSGRIQVKSFSGNVALER